MRKTLLIVMAMVAACDSDEEQPLCTTHATTYQSSVVYCRELDDAICTEDKGPGGAILCRQLCNDEGPACDEGLWWRSILVTHDDGTSGSICYCEPPPGEPVRDYMTR